MTLAQEIYRNFIFTIIAFVVLLLFYLAYNVISVRKIDSQRQRRKSQIRAFYVAIGIYAFVLAKIWMEGFTHLLAIFGLVSAALVMTNKETIMNLVAWLVINWRSLFVEDDLIQVQQFKGYVTKLGILYFTLQEVVGENTGVITGKIIRVPNGLVMMNPIINYSQISHILEQHFSIVFNKDSNILEAKAGLKKVVEDVIAEKYREKKQYSLDYLILRNKRYAKRIHLDVTVAVQAKLDKPSGYEMTVRYYCFSEDCEEIRQIIWENLLQYLSEHSELRLSYVE